MTRFHFPLQRVLDWRRTELEMAEAELRRVAAAIAAIDNASADLQAGGGRAECEVRQWNPVGGEDLGSLGEYRIRVRSETERLAAKRAECARELAQRRAVMLEARRRCRLLERLKERRMTEWKAACDRELEEIASESFMAQWERAGRPTL